MTRQELKRVLEEYGYEPGACNLADLLCGEVEEKEAQEEESDAHGDKKGMDRTKAYGMIDSLIKVVSEGKGVENSEVKTLRLAIVDRMSGEDPNIIRVEVLEWNVHSIFNHLDSLENEGKLKERVAILERNSDLRHSILGTNLKRVIDRVKTLEGKNE